jgi:predicted phage terminase large subunit-like protein
VSRRDEFYDLWYGRAKQAGYDGSILQWRDERYRAQTDLFWLAKELLGYDLVDSYVCAEHKSVMNYEPIPCSVCNEMLSPCPGLIPGISIHREMCNFFVKKNPDLDIFNQDTQKDRLMLVSRGSFKSSIDEADCVQWVICFPNIRVFLFTAEEGLGTIFIKHVKSFFAVEEAEDSKKHDPKYSYTRFQLLFPEHCRPEGRREAEDRFVTPARTDKNLKDPTLLALSIGASTAGKHCDVGKFDDCVSDGNSGAKANPETRETVRAQIFERRPVVALSGYRDYIGTIYDLSDAYGSIENKIEDIKVLKRPSYVVKEESKHKKEEDLTEADLNILFPYDAKGREQLSYRNLMKEKRADPVLFHCFPENAPVLTADWKEKPIQELKVGDKIIGIQLQKDGKNNRKLIEATVEYVHSEKSEVIKVTTNFGRVFYTTPDHKFLRHNKNRYGVLREGTKLVTVYTLKELTTKQEHLDLAWLGGMMDGEGTCHHAIQLSQSIEKNPEVCKKLESVLERLGITYKIWKNSAHGMHSAAQIYTLRGGRNLRIRLLQYGEMGKRNRFLSSLWKPRYVSEYGSGKSEKVISIEPIGEQIVYNIQSSTGNFVCYGLAVKNCQYQLDPLATRIANFTDQLIRSHIVKPESLPQTYRCFAAWDFAHSDGKGRDFSVGTVVWFDDIGRRFIVDVVRGRFSKPDLARKVAQQAARWRVETIGIENSGAVDFSEVAIRRQLIMLNYGECPIEYFKVDPSKNAKESRAENLETLLVNDQLWFSSEIPQLNEVINEFKNFKPSSKRKDDVIDSIAHAMRFAPEIIAQPESEQARQQKVYEIFIEKQLHELIYNLKEPEPEPELPPTHYDGYPILCMGCAMPITSCFCR